MGSIGVDGCDGWVIGPTGKGDGWVIGPTGRGAGCVTGPIGDGAGCATGPIGDGDGKGAVGCTAGPIGVDVGKGSGLAGADGICWGTNTVGLFGITGVSNNAGPRG